MEGKRYETMEEMRRDDAGFRRFQREAQEFYRALGIRQPASQRPASEGERERVVTFTPTAGV